MGIPQLRASFERVSALGDQFTIRFFAEVDAYATAHPGLGLHNMFPVSMKAQRGKFAEALVRIVGEADQLPRLAPFLARLGATHYHRDVTDAMYPVVGELLCEALKWAEGGEWAAVSADWAEAYGVAATVMMDGAAEEAKLGPPSWPASVVSVTRPEGCPDVAILTVGTEPEVTWTPGSWLELETPGRPRVWWKGCPANLPDGRGLLEFHVRAAGRGGASDALACLEPEAPLRIGMTGGRFALDTASSRDIVMAADSTGVAPLLALLGVAATFQAPPAVTLFFGADHAGGLYALDGLRKYAADHPWLAVVPVDYSADGPLHKALVRGLDWSLRDIYLAGPAVVTAACRADLVATGVPPEQIRARSYGRNKP